MDTSHKDIFLSFDDGPIPGVTAFVLETLKKHKAKATFFCVGDNVAKYPEIYSQLIEEGHAVGNHTYNHLNGWNTHTSTYLSNVKKCSELVSSKLFRPPYGRIKKSQASLLSKDFKLIMWDVLSGDFDRGITKEQCLGNVIENTREGSIVVFHDSEKAKDNLYYALPKMLEHFSALGYSFKAIL